MPMRIEPLDLDVGGRRLRGTKYVPSGDGPFPAAVLHHGFGGHRTEASRSFVQLARALVRHDIVVVAVDRAGHGESDGDFADTTVSGDVTDSIEVLELVAAADDVDTTDLHLMGTSLGAVVASIVAVECPFEIRSLTMWSPAALFVDEIRGGHLQGRPIDEVEQQGYFDFRGLRVGPEFFDDAREFDVYGRAHGYEGPVRILHGDRDFIPARYAEDYGSVYGDAMDYSLVAGADHCWEAVPARDHVIAETVAFVVAHASGAA